MTWIKICGITNLEDALTAVDAGADALGFVFYEKSPRKVDAETARAIVEKLPERVEKVGVFVDETVNRVSHVAATVQLTGAQLHGSEDLEFASRLTELSQGKLRIIKAAPACTLDQPQGGSYSRDPVSMGVLSAEDAPMFASFDGREFRPGPISALILDSGPAGQGGTGKTLDWEKLRFFSDGMSRFTKIIVAGGLAPANVARAINILHPWGVDVASGVEARPGKKDPDKVRAFIAAVRAADRVD